MQADSGPIAGDRMIGSFSRQADRLVIHIDRLIHQGEEITADGVVTAPQHDGSLRSPGKSTSRLAPSISVCLPHLLAGLGQALATTSNSTAPPVWRSDHYNQPEFPVSSSASPPARRPSRIGSTRRRRRGQDPFFPLDNCSVGVMFLSNVVDEGDPS